jgi:hypothetical protein
MLLNSETVKNDHGIIKGRLKELIEKYPDEDFDGRIRIHKSSWKI